MLATTQRTQPTNPTLSTLLLSALPALANATTVRLRVAASPFTECSAPVKSDGSPATRRHWLFLFSLLEATSDASVTESKLNNEKDSGSSSGPGLSGAEKHVEERTTSTSTFTPESLLAALYVTEYITPKSRSLHIEKVDSTGNRPPLSQPSLTRALVAACTSWVVGQQQPSTSNLQTTIHCFARPQPEYLFTGSSKRHSKKPMEPPQLTAWWMKTLDLACSLSSSSEGSTATKSLYSPPIDSLDNLGTILRTASKESSFTYGHPYDPNALAAEAVHIFPDDPKGRLLKDLNKESTIKELWGISGLALDAAGGGFIWIQFDGIKGDKEKEEEVKIEISEKEWNSLMSNLEAGDYSTSESCQVAATELLQKWPASGLVFDVVIPGGAEPTKKEEPVAVVNTLNVGLLKRKPKKEEAAGDTNAKKVKS